MTTKQRTTQLIKNWYYEKSGIQLMYDPRLTSLAEDIEELYAKKEK